MNIGDQQKAIEAFSKAIELTPDPYYFLNRAYSFQRINNIEAARRDAQVAMQSGLAIDNSFLQSLGLK